MYGSFVVYVWRSVGGWRIFFFLSVVMLASACGRYQTGFGSGRIRSGLACILIDKLPGQRNLRMSNSNTSRAWIKSGSDSDHEWDRAESDPIPYGSGLTLVSVLLPTGSEFNLCATLRRRSFLFQLRVKCDQCVVVYVFFFLIVEQLQKWRSRHTHVSRKNEPRRFQLSCRYREVMPVEWKQE